MTYFLAVGTFDKNLLYILEFTLSKEEGITGSTLKVVSTTSSPGPHSWLSLNANHTRLYATNWTEPPGLASYSININEKNKSNIPEISLINVVETASRSGYCCNSSVAVYSAGGASGEVFSIDQSTGGFLKEIQKLEFVEKQLQKDDGSILDFGGLRNGSHSADLSKDGKMLYIADLGRNCIFVYAVAEDGTLTLTDKNIATRSNDSPRHVTPHSNGKYVYSLQEHSSMVDVFELLENKTLKWIQGVKIIPQELSCTKFWADEVRISSNANYLFASTRGLEHTTKGYVAAFSLLPSGLLASEIPITIYETPTSGGWANAIEPATKSVEIDGIECDLIALTDEEQGFVFMLKFDGKEFTEIARTQLPEGKAATAVWL